MTYGIRHTVRGWDPTDVVTTVVICGCGGESAPEGYTFVTRAGEGPVILVPTAALTPVDTTPAEPEPGVYFIGKDGEAWQHFADRADEQRWCVVGYQRIYTWAQVWATVGGPGITPRRLVPEPEPVELPWTMDGGHATVGIGPTLKLAGGCDSLYMGSDEAIGLGRALIEAGGRSAAARAAREVKP